MNNKKDTAMLLRFWGVCGSLPTPPSTEDIERKIIAAVNKARKAGLGSLKEVRTFVRNLPLHERGTFGGNTSCTELVAGKNRIVLDAGSGLKKLGNRMMADGAGTDKRPVHIFISHTHWDHIQGFPFFVPAYVPGNTIHIYGCHPRLKQRFNTQQRFDLFPISLDGMAADIRFHRLAPGRTFRMGDDTAVTPVELNHPGGAYGYRIDRGGRSVIYASDVEYADMEEKEARRYLDFYRGADVLVSDSQYTLQETFDKKYWGHSSALVGVEIALKAGIGTLVLFHHEPEYDDATIAGIQEQARQYGKLIPSEHRCEVVAGYEGLEIKL